jgi:peptidoglycan/LPS O-acetylase OafA/YrhL
MRLSGSETERSRALDGLRGLAALSVLSFHVWLYRADRPHGARTALVDKVLFEANLGLICFFVLSGYLLYRPFARAALTGSGRVSVRTYAVRRVARIVPAYYACLLGCIALYGVTGHRDLVPSPEYLPLFVVFAQNYSLETLMQIDPVFWTLCIEAAFYAVLPLLGLLALRLGPARVRLQGLGLVALLLITVGWNALDWALGWGEIPRKTLIAYIGYFALGMLVATWLEQRSLRLRTRLRPRASAGLAALGWALVIATAWWHESPLAAGTLPRTALSNLPAALGFALVVAAATAGGGWSVRWLTSRPLVALGTVSYGVYLWHLPLIIVMRDAGMLPDALPPRLLVVFATATAVATLSWLLLERPLIRRAWPGRRPVVARPVPAPL